MVGAVPDSLDECSLAELDGILQRAELLRFPDASPQSFHEQVIPPLMAVLCAGEASVWLTGDESALCLFITVDGQQGNLESELRQKSELIANWARQAAENSVTSEECSSQNGSGVAHRCRRELVPSRDLVVEFRFSSGNMIATEASDTLFVLCGLVAEFHRGRLLFETHQQTQRLQQAAAFAHTMHERLDYRQVAAVLAGDGPHRYGVDRISVLRCGARWCRLLAVTGVAVINDRADVARTLERLVLACRSANLKPSWLTPDNVRSRNATESDASPADEIPPVQLIEDCFRVCGSTALKVFPLNVTGDTWDGSPAAVVLEHFDNVTDGRTRVTAPSHDAVQSLITTEAALAFHNSLQFERRSLSGRLLMLAEGLKSRRFAATSGCLAVLVLLLWLVPADFEIEVSGRMQPEFRRQVFAPDDGIITSVLVGNEHTVASGDLLFEIHNADLAIELQRLQGEIQTTASRLDAVEAARLGQGGAGLENVSPGQLSAESRILNQKMTTLNRQRELVQEQLGLLKVRSPIGGQVFRRDLMSDLNARPVKQGQQLLEVVQPDGPWRLELRVPDRVIRHVRAAWETSAAGLQPSENVTAGLPVRFILRTAPEQTWHERVTHVGVVTELDETGNLSSEAIVPLTSTKMEGLRPGAGVIASIHCGRRPLGFVWFRELIEFVQTHVLF